MGDGMTLHYNSQDLYHSHCNLQCKWTAMNHQQFPYNSYDDLFKNLFSEKHQIAGNNGWHAGRLVGTDRYLHFKGG